MYNYLVGIYGDDDDLIQAVRKVKAAGLEIHDCITPFPVHGLEKAMELKETRLHTAGFFYGATGTMFALGCMTWIQTSSWPLNVGGKPNFSLLSFIPITFELTVLFAAVGMTVTYYLRNRLSIFNHDEVLDVRLTDHKFAMIFDMAKYDSQEDINRIKRVLESTKVEEINVREMKHKVYSAEEQS